MFPLFNADITDPAYENNPVYDLTANTAAAGVIFRYVITCTSQFVPQTGIEYSFDGFTPHGRVELLGTDIRVTPSSKIFFRSLGGEASVIVEADRFIGQ